MNPAALLQAACFAARKHRDQRRKDAAESPYINHPLAGVNVLASEAGVIDQSLLIAALLHDTVEDTAITFDSLIEAKVPPQVIVMVDNLTLRKGEETYYDYIIRVAEAQTMARWIKAEDLIHNGSSLSKGSMLDKYRFAYARVTGENPPF